MVVVVSVKTYMGLRKETYSLRYYPFGGETRHCTNNASTRILNL